MLLSFRVWSVVLQDQDATAKGLGPGLQPLLQRQGHLASYSSRATPQGYGVTLPPRGLEVEH